MSKLTDVPVSLACSQLSLAILSQLLSETLSGSPSLPLFGSHLSSFVWTFLSTICHLFSSLNTNSAFLSIAWINLLGIPAFGYRGHFRD